MKSDKEYFKVVWCCDYCNKEFKMKDFKFHGQFVSFKIATSELNNLKNLITKDFKVTYA